MSKELASSIGELLQEAHLKVEIDARQQSYAVALELVKSSGSFEVWRDVADKVYDKIKKDMSSMGMK